MCGLAVDRVAVCALVPVVSTVVLKIIEGVRAGGAVVRRRQHGRSVGCEKRAANAAGVVGHGARGLAVGSGNRRSQRAKLMRAVGVVAQVGQFVRADFVIEILFTDAAVVIGNRAVVFAVGAGLGGVRRHGVAERVAARERLGALVAAGAAVVVRRSMRAVRVARLIIGSRDLLIERVRFGREDRHHVGVSLNVGVIRPAGEGVVVVRVAVVVRVVSRRGGVFAVGNVLREADHVAVLVIERHGVALDLPTELRGVGFIAGDNADHGIPAIGGVVVLRVVLSGRCLAVIARGCAVRHVFVRFQLGAVPVLPDDGVGVDIRIAKGDGGVAGDVRHGVGDHVAVFARGHGAGVGRRAGRRGAVGVTLVKRDAERDVVAVIDLCGGFG